MTRPHTTTPGDGVRAEKRGRKTTRFYHLRKVLGSYRRYWLIEIIGGCPDTVIEEFVDCNKRQATRRAVIVVNDILDSESNEVRTVSLRICNLDGTFEEERTYPKSHDPRGRQG